jgi:hypothetical protein
VEASVSGTEGGGGWFTSAVVLTVSASDAGSGVALTEYRVPGAFDWTEYLGPAEFSTEGEWVLEARSTDLEGNIGADSAPFRVDTTAPVTSSAAEGPVVNLTSVDDGSGVDATFYRLDDGEWTLYEGPFEVVGEGNHTLDYWSVDVAGNEEDAETRQVEVIRTETTFSLDWWMVILVLALLAMIAAGAIFGMRRKATESAARSAFRDMPSVMSQMMDDNPAAKPGDTPPADTEPAKPK